MVSCGYLPKTIWPFLLHNVLIYLNIESGKKKFADSVCSLQKEYLNLSIFSARVNAYMNGRRFEVLSSFIVDYEKQTFC